jgi:uridine kinase
MEATTDIGWHAFRPSLPLPSSSLPPLDNFDHPDAFDSQLMMQCLSELKVRAGGQISIHPSPRGSRSSARAKQQTSVPLMAVSDGFAITSLYFFVDACMQAGRAVEVPYYDFSQHARSQATRRVEPADVVVIEGILVLHIPEIRWGAVGGRKRSPPRAKDLT